MAIVTDKLTHYWHYQSKCSQMGWENIAPTATSGVPIGVMNNITFNNGIPYFNGTNSSVDFTGVNWTSPSYGFTIEVILSRAPNYTPEGVGVCAYYSDSERIVMSTYGEFAGFGKLETFFTRGSFYSLKRDDIKIQTEDVHLTFTYAPSIKKFYRDGKLIVSNTETTLPFSKPYNLYIGANFYNGVKSIFHKGNIYVVRIYNRELTEAEVLQNYNNKMDIGLGSSAPIASIISSTKSKISRISGQNKTYITFKFDKDVQAYKVMVGGVDYQTGYLADSGGAKTANTEIVAEIDDTELSIEGINRVTIYGQGLDGKWSTKD
ncbi:LamG domain-containing protein [Bacillus phage vB_BanS-Thrax1]|nr:LamG domain-containing protein [Bacillus phage vB_BanS-Thrax1]